MKAESTIRRQLAEAERAYKSAPATDAQRSALWGIRQALWWLLGGGCQ